MSDPNDDYGRGGYRSIPDDDNFDAGNPRQTERLGPEIEDWKSREPVNPGWRRERSTTANRVRAKREGGGPAASVAARFPSSPQELQIWMQRGGWKYVAAVAALFLLLLIALLAFSRNGQREAGLQLPTTTTDTSAELGSGSQPLEQQPLVTSVPPTSAAPAPGASSGAAFVVGNTNGLGLFMRSAADQNSEILTTLPDGTRLEQIGADVTAANYVWRNVRTPDGQEGWVAIDFLQPAP